MYEIGSLCQQCKVSPGVILFFTTSWLYLAGYMSVLTAPSAFHIILFLAFSVLGLSRILALFQQPLVHCKGKNIWLRYLVYTKHIQPLKGKLTSLTHVITNLYAFLTSKEPKRKYFLLKWAVNIWWFNVFLFYCSIFHKPSYTVKHHRL